MARKPFGDTVLGLIFMAAVGSFFGAFFTSQRVDSWIGLVLWPLEVPILSIALVLGLLGYLAYWRWSHSRPAAAAEGFRERMAQGSYFRPAAADVAVLTQLAQAGGKLRLDFAISKASHGSNLTDLEMQHAVDRMLTAEWLEYANQLGQYPVIAMTENAFAYVRRNGIEVRK